MNILSIDTSCDETAVAITYNTKVLSNTVWSQTTLHARLGGIMPSLAQRAHKEKIDFVVQKALGTRNLALDIDVIAVTVGPGLSIALEVGIKKAKELAKKYKLPLIPINHVEAHLLSPLANSKSEFKFPALGLVVSGGTTQLILVKNIGNYEILAETVDDALGEALDKAARLLGFGYPGGAVLEKIARSAGSGQARFKLPLPLQNDVVKNRFSYSGLKTAFVRLVEKIKNPNKQDIADLAASFQSVAFDHVLKVLEYQIKSNAHSLMPSALLLGGGVANNIELRKKLRKISNKYQITLHTPYTKKLNGDNAAMVGVCAYLKNKNLNAKELYDKYSDYDSVDRNPRLKI